MGSTTFTSYQNNDRSYVIAPSTFGTVEQSHYTYIGFADSDSGGGFTTTYDNSKLFYAVKVSATALTPLYSNFVGLWMPFEKHRDDKYATYSNKKILSNGNIGLWHVSAMAQPQISPGSYHYKGIYNRIYFCILDGNTDAAGSNRSGHTHLVWVYYYDIDTGTFSLPVSLPQTYPTSLDYHDTPSIIVTSDGYILICKEKLTGTGSNNHNSQIEFYRSTAVETIEDPGNPGNHYFTTAVTSSATPYKCSYPKFAKGSTDDEIMCFCRGYSSGDLFNLVAIRSQDGGETWDSLSGTSNEFTLIAECEDIAGDVACSWRFYNYVPKGPEGTYGYHVIGQLNEGDDPAPDSGINGPDGEGVASRHKYVVYLQSNDGETWNNFSRYITGSGGFSKDIVTSGAITMAEVNANLIIADVATDANVTYSLYDYWLDADGVPYILTTKYYRYSPYDVTTYDLKENVLEGRYLLYWSVDTDAWVERNITTLFADSTKNPFSDASEQAVYSIRTTMVAYKDGVLDIIIQRINDRDAKSVVDSTMAPGFFPPMSSISTTADLVERQTYRIHRTTTDNFFSGCAVNDYTIYNGQTVGEADSLIGVQTETVFFRTTDNGVTWCQVREPYISSISNLCTYNPPLSSNSNMHDSGYLATFEGKGRALTPTSTAIDHVAFTMFVDKIQI